MENPYSQYFCGEQYFRHELPIDPSSLTRWRQRLGEEGVDELLAQTIETTRREGVVKRQSLEQVTIDTTVQEGDPGVGPRERARGGGGIPPDAGKKRHSRSQDTSP